MKTVYKYPVRFEDWFAVEMPVGAKVLSVGVQRVRNEEQPVMWALVTPGARTEQRKFRLAGTGHPIEDATDLNFVGTFQVAGGSLVFHLFSLPGEPQVRI